MKTLPELLDQHKITTLADRLEFEEVVNEVTRQHGAELQAAHLNFEKELTSRTEASASETDAVRAENAALQSELASLREKASLAVKANMRGMGT